MQYEQQTKMEIFFLVGDKTIKVVLGTCLGDKNNNNLLDKISPMRKCATVFEEAGSVACYNINDKENKRQN